MNEELDTNTLEKLIEMKRFRVPLKCKILLIPII